MAERYETIEITKDKGITFVTLNRPDKRNAMSPQLHREMDEALDDLAVDPETQVLVLTGAGEAFCAGQDIELFFRAGAKDPAMMQRTRRASNPSPCQTLPTFPHPPTSTTHTHC